MGKLFRGIFWIKDIDDLDVVVIKSECNKDGFFLEAPDCKFLSKSGKEFNHKKAWSMLPKSKTESKPYNHFPRGRVEVRNKKAFIYANGNIADERLKNWVIREFGLTKSSGIKSVTVKVDMSNHYLCYLDKEV